LKIIAIEGIDKSGKASQCRMLKERLRAEGVNVMQSEFHRYDTPTGDLIMKWLKKEYDVDQRTIEFIMAADKQAQQQWFQQLEDSGVQVLILDRYLLSQRCYAIANGATESDVDALHQYLRAPNMSIVIDIPASVSMARKGKHNDGNNDRYESDHDMLERARQLFLTPFHGVRKSVIDANDKTIEEIHEEIYTIVSALL
jgi:dTMP kinase